MNFSLNISINRNNDKKENKIRCFRGTAFWEIQKGKIKWILQDDLGKDLQYFISNSLYYPQGGVLILIPQHWENIR